MAPVERGAVTAGVLSVSVPHATARDAAPLLPVAPAGRGAGDRPPHAPDLPVRRRAPACSSGSPSWPSSGHRRRPARHAWRTGRCGCRRWRPAVGLLIAAAACAGWPAATSPSTADEYVRSFHDQGDERGRPRPVLGRVLASIATIGYGGAPRPRGPVDLRRLGDRVDRAAALRPLLLPRGRQAAAGRRARPRASPPSSRPRPPARCSPSRCPTGPTSPAATCCRRWWPPAPATSRSPPSTAPSRSCRCQRVPRSTGGTSAAPCVVGLAVRRRAPGCSARAIRFLRGARSHHRRPVGSPGSPPPASALALLVWLSDAAADAPLVAGSRLRRDPLGDRSGPRPSGWCWSCSCVRVGAVLATYGGGGAGGLFIPLVVIGALTGRLAGDVVRHGRQSTCCVVVGMAAFLGAGYRTPLAGVMFVAETTGQPGVRGAGAAGHRGVTAGARRLVGVRPPAGRPAGTPRAAVRAADQRGADDRRTHGPARRHHRGVPDRAPRRPSPASRCRWSTTPTGTSVWPCWTRWWRFGARRGPTTDVRTIARVTAPSGPHHVAGARRGAGDGARRHRRAARWSTVTTASSAWSRPTRCYASTRSSSARTAAPPQGFVPEPEPVRRRDSGVPPLGEDLRRRAGRGRRCRTTGGAASTSPAPRSGGCARG